MAITDHVDVWAALAELEKRIDQMECAILYPPATEPSPEALEIARQRFAELRQERR